MNTATQAALIKVLADLQEVAANLPHPGAGELMDSCGDAIRQLNQDETVTETR